MSHSDKIKALDKQSAAKKKEIKEIINTSNNQLAKIKNIEEKINTAINDLKLLASRVTA